MNTYDDRNWVPEAWWRRLCWLDEHRLALCGDLPRNRADAARQLSEWVDAGVTHIVDLRTRYETGDDLEFVAARAPQVTYHWIGIDDDGNARPAAWFDDGVTAALHALTDPDARVVIHCHMGVNRAPSMAAAALMALGEHHLTALDTIRRVRPIAAAIYADDAVAWWLGETGAHQRDVQRALLEVESWHDDNALDVSWIIDRIDRYHVSLANRRR